MGEIDSAAQPHKAIVVRGRLTPKVQARYSFEDVASLLEIIDRYREWQYEQTVWAQGFATEAPPAAPVVEQSTEVCLLWQKGEKACPEGCEVPECNLWPRAVAAHEASKRAHDAAQSAGDEKEGGTGANGTQTCRPRNAPIMRAADYLDARHVEQSSPTPSPPGRTAESAESERAAVVAWLDKIILVAKTAERNAWTANSAKANRENAEFVQSIRDAIISGDHLRGGR